jgi:hypothetical protein
MKIWTRIWLPVLLRRLALISLLTLISLLALHRL